MNPLDNIRVVLVGTLYTGNVGSSCRAMANMGIRHLRLAAPNLQNGWDEGERLAVHATDVLGSREEFATLEEAVADCGLLRYGARCCCWKSGCPRLPGPTGLSR